MRSTVLSYKAIGRQMGYHYTVVSRLVRKHTQTNHVKDLQRSGRPLVTSQREYRHCNAWLDECHSQQVLFLKENGYLIDSFQPEP